MAISIKLLDGNTYSLQRESYLVQDESSEMRKCLYGLYCMLDGSELAEMETKAKGLDRLIARLKGLAYAAQENLERQDLSQEERAVWRKDLESVNEQLGNAVSEIEKLELAGISRMRESREWTMEVARWAVARQLRKTEIEADLLLNPKLANEVVLAILGIDPKEMKIGGAEDESPLSENSTENGGGAAS